MAAQRGEVFEWNAGPCSHRSTTRGRFGKRASVDFHFYSALAPALVLCNKDSNAMRYSNASKTIGFPLLVVALLAVLLPSQVRSADNAGLKIFSLAAAEPVSAGSPTPVVALVGGGGDVDEAMEFLCRNSGGGNIVVLRASGDDAYNPYFHKLCPHNSVSTVLITSAEGARDPAAIELLRNAHAIFIAGGDQFNYVKMWSGNPVQAEINAAIARGVPIGGISAGLAVLGEYAFSARHDTVTSEEALANPYDEKVSLERAFLNIPIMSGIITDSHFSERHRLGRTLVFAARISQDGWSDHPRAIGIDQSTAVLVNADGTAKVVGKGFVYFIELRQKPSVCAPGKLLAAGGFEVYKILGGSASTLNLASWTVSKGVIPIPVNVADGKISGLPE
jgi:cyanophycinase